MANMSYCRFQNTLGDFEDCVDAIDNAKELSLDEQRAAFWLIKRARELAEQFEDHSDDDIWKFIKSFSGEED